MAFELLSSRGFQDFETTHEWLLHVRCRNAAIQRLCMPLLYPLLTRGWPLAISALLLALALATS